MGVLGNIWVKLGLKSDDFRKGMDQSEQKVSKFGQAAQKMSMLAKAAWVAVGAAVVKFGKEAVKAYNEQMEANAKLQNAIKNTNGALGLEFRELEKFASQIQSSFNVADDAVMNAMSTMTTFKTITGETFKQAMLAAVDMASFMKTDLNSAVRQLGKALEVPEIYLSQLSRSGVVFTNEQIANIKKLVAAGKQYEAQQLILIEVQKKFGGAAAAAAETAGGKWTGFKMAVGDLMETLGSGIEKTKGVANALKEVVEYTNYILSSKHLSKWEKFWGTMGLATTKQEVYDKALKAAAAEEKKLKEIGDTAQWAADKYKTIEEVQNRISQIQRKNNDRNSISQSAQTELKELELLESKLQGLIIKRSEEEEAASEAAAKAEESAKKAAEEKKKIQKEYNDWLINSTKDANDELIQLQIQVEKSRVDAMADGSAKRKAQFSLGQKEAIIEMQRYERNVLNEQAKLEKNKGMSIGYGTFEVGADGTLAYKLAESGLTLTPEQQNVINEMVRKFNQDIVDTWVTEVTDLDIDSGYNLADKLLEELDEDMIAWLANGGFSSLKEQASIIFADISELSSDMIQQIISNAEEYINTPGLTDEAIAKYREAIDKANEYLVKNDPWAALKIAQERYVKAVADYNKATEDYNTASNADDKKAKAAAIKEQNAAILEQAQALSIVRQAYDALGNAITGIVGNVGSLFEEMGVDGEVFEGIKQMIDGAIKMAVELAKLDTIMKSLADTSKDTGEEVSDMASNIGGALTSAAQQTQSAELAIIGLFIQIITAIVKIGNASNKASEELRQSKIDEYVEKVDRRIEKLTDDLDRLRKMTGIGDSWFTEDLYNNIVQAERAITKAQESFLDVFARISEAYNEIYAGPRRSSGGSYSTDGMQSAANNLLALLKEVKNIVDQISGADLGDSDIFSRFGLDGLGTIDAINEAIAQLKELEATYKAEGWEKLAADTKEAYENLEEYLTAYEELKSTVTSAVGNISGTLYDTVTVEWKKIWQKNKEAGADSFAGIAEAAKKNIAQIMESIVTQQIWASVMAPVFDSFGTNLTNAIAGGGDITSVFDDFFAGFDAQLKGYYDAIGKFYSGAEAKGWDFTEPKSEEDALQKLVDKQKLLNELHKQWIDLYGQDTADAMLSGMGADASSYVKALEDSIAELDALREAGTITDEQLQQLQNFQDQLLSIRDAAAEAAAEAEAEAKAASQAAYDAWSANMQAGLNGAADQYEQLLAYEAAIKAAVEDTSMSEEDRAKAIQEATDAQAELYKQVRAGLESTYATDDDKWAAQQEQYRKDIEWATNNGLPLLAQKIQDAWDAEVIKRSTEAMDEWKSSVDEALSGVETGRVDAIIKAQQDYVAQALASGEMPSVEKLMYFADLMQAEQKSLNEKYETEEEKHLKTLAEYDADYNDAKLLGDEELMAKILAERQKYNDDYIQQAKDNASAEIQAALESSDEYKALTGDLAKLGVQEARKALDAYRKMVESSTDLSDEAKEEILAGLDEIQEKIDNIELDNLQQQFEDIQSVISSISSILSSFGASSELTEGLSGLSNVIGGLFSVISGGTWVDKFAGIASMIGGIVTVAKSLKGLFSTGNEDLTSGVDALSAAYQKLVGIMNKAFGDNKTALQNQAIDNIKAQIAEYQKLIDKELAKGNGFLARLFGLDTDEEAIAKYEKEIEKLFGDIAGLEEEQKRDFLQTDTDSFVNSLRDIWAQSYDSAEDYYNALKKLNQTTIDDIIARWIEKKLVEDQVNNSLQKLYDSGLNDSSFELFSSEIQAISDAAKAEYERWQQAGYFQKETGESSMDGSIARTATEAQFNQYLGYIQNINITAHDILNAVKNQPALIDFSAMVQLNRAMANDMKRTADNTEYCRMLEGIKNDLAAIRRGGSPAYN